MVSWLLRVFLCLYMGGYVKADSSINSSSTYNISRPQLGEGFYLLGQFNCVSNFDSTIKYNLSHPQPDSLYRVPQKGVNVTLLQSNPFNGSTPDNLYSIDEYTVLAVVDGKPVLYDSSSLTSSLLSGWNNVSGDVSAVLVDDQTNTLYLGGNLQYDDSYGAVAYSLDSEELVQLPFSGFNKGGKVQAISKYGQNSIIFGGQFNSLGNDTLQRSETNSTTVNNSSSSLIQPEQQINLNFATISTANSASQTNPDSIICPGNSSSWTMSEEQDGGSWTAVLPWFVTSSKIRLRNGNTDGNGVSMFRIITAPADGIMNLTYIDPSTLTLKTCDAWCPLAQVSDLTDAISNASNITDGVYQISDVSDIEGTLSFSDEYQEFEFVNTVSMDSITILVLDHYGNTGVLDGLQLYQYGMTINANNSLNAIGCSSDQQQIVPSSQSIGDLDWQNGVSGSYLTAAVAADSIEPGTQGIRYDSNLEASGNYTFFLYTTGCSLDNTCSERGIVNATLYAGNGTILGSQLVYQSNDELKYDDIFSGNIDPDDDGSPYMTVTLDSGLGSDEVVVVADYVMVQFNQIDYNATNTTSDSIPLNGLFEYSLTNFTEDVEHPVGNSSINQLGASLLSQDAIVNGLEIVNDTQLYIAGEFNSSYGSNFFGVDLGKYNGTSDEISTAEVFSIDGGLNSAVSGMSLSSPDDLLLVGGFDGTSNASDVDVNGITLYNGTFHSLSVSDSAAINGSAIPFTFNQTDYFIVHYESSSAIYTLPDGEPLSESSILGLNVSQASSVQNSSSFAFGEIVMFDEQVNDAVFLSNGSTLSGIQQIFSPSNGSFIDTGLYLNSSSVVLAGQFGGNNVVLVTGKESTPLSKDLTFSNNSTVVSLFNYGNYLYVGFNGEATYQSSSFWGLAAYNLDGDSGIIYPSSIESGSINAMDTDPVSTSLLIGGNFTSDDCSTLCFYNVSKNSLSAALSESNSASVSGTISDLKYYAESLALIGGNLSIDSTQSYFALYNFTSKLVSNIEDASDSIPGPVVTFEFARSDDHKQQLNDTIYVLGSDYVGYLKDLEYTDLLDGIDNSTSSVYTDIALINGTTEQEQFLVLTGSFNLTDYGLVTSAVYDGKLWFPLIISATDLNTENSIVNSVLRTSKSYSKGFNTTSSGSPGSEETEKGIRYLTNGQVAGVGCALAIGTTLILTALGGAVYLFGRRNTVVGPLKSRVGEEKMMSALPPDQIIDSLNKAKGF
ncbi:hypothetical protein FOA43_001430 [Brettanomyces nanus]|uniref:Uncharacterized protein n=1 Tax=Eeniella nana TaxID=13502 RepID=A0A875RZF6_EENNA|nr:uncharacterized protein FOA43_001430 [Brettanomyces nanus]QPG74108.1 hypothetical protein FOA43_001430 [Brettanomyces nanus]